MNFNNKEVLISDLDGTLIKFPLYGLFKSWRWRSLCSWFFSVLPASTQIKLGYPTSSLELLKNKEEVFLVTARKDTGTSRKKVNAILNHFKLDLPRNRVLLKPPKENIIDYKERVIKRISRRYRKVLILEDNREIRARVEKFGSIESLN